MTFNVPRLCTAISLMFTVSMIQPALAKDIEIEAPISAVTMYRNGGAIVTRNSSFTLPAGTHTVTISGLTDDLDEEYGVRARFTNGGAVVSQVKLEESFSSAVVADSQKALIEQIQSLEGKNTNDRATLDSLKIQLDFIEKLGTNAGNKAVEGNSDPDTLFATLQKSLEFVRTNSGSIVAERTALNAAISARDQEILALKRQLAQTGSERKSYIDANIAVTNATAGTVSLQLSYMVDDANWSVETEANLGSAAKATTVKLFAQVSQQTGEDWANIPLILSTTTPSANIKNYKPRPVYMNLADPKSPQEMSNLLQKVREGRITGSDIEEVVVSGSRFGVNSTTFDAEFVLGAATSVPSDGSQQRFLVSTATADAAVVLRTTPRQNRTAYVYGDAELTGLPYLRSPSVSLTRDGTYVGSGIWPDLKPNAPLELPFGASDRVKVEVITLPGSDGGSGIFSKRVNREERMQFRITNNNSVPITIEVFDRVPNSKHEDLKIERLKGSTNATATNIDEQPGVVMWRKTVAAGEVWAINNWYKISYPEGKQLTR